MSNGEEYDLLRWSLLKYNSFLTIPSFKDAKALRRREVEARIKPNMPKPDKASKTILNGLRKNYAKSGLIQGNSIYGKWELCYGVREGSWRPEIDSNICYGLHQTEPIAYIFGNKDNKERFEEARLLNAKVLAKKTTPTGKPIKTSVGLAVEMSGLPMLIEPLRGEQILAVIKVAHLRYGDRLPETSYEEYTPPRHGSQLFLKLTWRDGQ